jgi:hypothetical protein
MLGKFSCWTTGGFSRRAQLQLHVVMGRELGRDEIKIFQK